MVDDAVAARGEGARHAAEIPYVFNTLSIGDLEGSGPHHAVARTMNATWRSFAETGEPNGSGLMHWPDYASNQIMEFKLHGQSVYPDVRNDRLDALSALVEDRS